MRGQCKIRSTREKRTFSTFSNSTTLCRSIRISISFPLYDHLEVKVSAFQNSDSIVSWRCDIGIKYQQSGILKEGPSLNRFTFGTVLMLISSISTCMEMAYSTQHFGRLHFNIPWWRLIRVVMQAKHGHFSPNFTPE